MIEQIKHRYKKGSVLAYILIIVSISMILLISVIQIVISRIQYAQYRENTEQSFQIAEAGIYFYRWYLAHEIEGKTMQQIKNFWENGSPLGVGSVYEQDVFDIDGTIRGRYAIRVTPPEAYSTIVLVEAEGWSIQNPENKRTIQVRFRRPSWSEYAVLGNNYMRFGDGTTIMGPLHVNGGVHFDGVSHNVVSSAVTQYYDDDSDVRGWHPGVWSLWSGEYNTNMSANVFSGGKSFPTTEKSFASVSTNLSLIKDSAITSNTYFDDDRVGRHIILNSNGTFSIRKVRTYISSTNKIDDYSGGWETRNIPDNGVIYVEDNIWLEGIIQNKRVTIVAANLVGGVAPNIFIEKSIRYTNYDGRDILGVIAENNIEITKASENNLRIDGALLAQNGRVGRTHYTDYKNSITVFGSIASNQRYGFAYTDGTGYAIRNLYYDNNLLYYPPPYFPTGDTYAIDLWREI
ncbi:MAG: hypothetical protein EOM19_02600 [Candidatus Moranbacteria bacterium]|nr:hypothetical protein [Candidatus Moranbacteria bacterium]